MELCQTFGFKMNIITPFDYFVFQDFLPFSEESSEMLDESADSIETDDQALSF